VLLNEEADSKSLYCSAGKSSNKGKCLEGVCSLEYCFNGVNLFNKIKTFWKDILIIAHNVQLETVDP